MKLSFIFELLLIFILIAFAASAVIDSSALHNSKRDVSRKHRKIAHKRQQGSTSNKYCSCSTKICNCCREFNIPVVSLQGPGCASLQYLKGDRLAISMSFGERVLTNTTISSKKPQPVCMPLPGGVSKFCGRVYNIGRKGEDFKACLGLELRALNDVEAALRVSCFRFGPNGLRVEPSQPLPAVEEEEDDDDDDDDDDDEDEYDFDDDDEEDDNEVDSEDYGTFSVFDDDYIDDYLESGSTGQKKKKPVRSTPAPVRVVTRKTTARPSKTNQRKPVSAKPAIPIKSSSVKVTSVPINQAASSPLKIRKPSQESVTTVILEGPVAEAANAKPVKGDSIPVPVRIMSAPVPTATPTTQQMPEMSTNILTEQPVELMSQGSVLKDVTEESINQTSLDSFELPSTAAAAEATTESNKDDSEEDDDDEDPFSEVVEEVLDDEVDSAEVTTKKPHPTHKDLNKTNGNKQSKDVIDDIVDGVVDTFAEEDSDEASANKTESNTNDDDDEDDDDETEDDDDEEDDDDDDEARKARRRRVKRFRGRQSRDMWLDRLHW